MASKKEKEIEQHNCAIWLMLEYRARRNQASLQHLAMLTEMRKEYNLARAEKAFGLTEE